MMKILNNQLSFKYQEEDQKVMFSTQKGDSAGLECALQPGVTQMCSGELVDPPPLSLPNSQGKKMKLALNDVRLDVVSWCQYFHYGKRKEINFLVNPAACSESQWREYPPRAPKS